ncbi:MAG: hypothetical protein HQ568_11610 [Calditrichaeota bacterium]|nr:hypothetical protein [Calditrichota bacterium]
MKHKCNSIAFLIILAVMICFFSLPAFAQDDQTDKKGVSTVENNPICYWELASHDSEKSVEFFKKVFNWNFEYDEKSTIHEMIAEPEMLQLAGGGVFTLKKAKLPFVALYIKVDDIEAKRKAVEEAGGFIVIEPVDIGGSGTKICLFNEPSGTTWAMIEKGKKEFNEELKEDDTLLRILKSAESDDK